MLDKSYRNFRGSFKRGSIWKRIKKKLKNKKFRRKLLAIVAISIAVFAISVVGVFAYFSKDLPSPDKINQRDITQSTKIYDRTGNTLLYEVHGEVKRTVVPLDQMSDSIKYATIAAEDQHFYKHIGFDPLGILRATFTNITSGEKPGGSTITQQFVKNSILTPEKTYSRKVKELILSLEMEMKFEKDEILQMYLNEIPYGSNAYGVQAASQTFFAKDANELSLAESALLASLPQAPTYYSPHGTHMETLKARQEWVLDRMLDLKYINAEEAESAKAEELKFQELRGGIIAPHFVIYVKEQLVEKYGEKMVEQGGLQVYTTLNMDMQRTAERVVPEGVTRNQKYNASNAALVAVDPKNGDILAMQGSKDYWDIENDGNVNVALSDRQPGSSFKPFAYAKAFQKGYTPDTILFDLITDFGGGYIPKNYNLGETGPLTMRASLANSKNITAVKTLYLAGVDDTIKLAREMGISTLTDSERYGLSLVLGGGEVKLLEEVAAFSVFANDGVKNEKKSILKVIDGSGKVLEENNDSEEKRVLDSQVARQINSILSDNTARSPTFGSSSSLYLGSRPAAAKTGTTQEYRDGWTIGYTPGLAVGIWAGNNDNSPMSNGAAGTYVAAPIWNAFMTDVLSGTDIEYFEKPDPVRTSKAVLNGRTAEEKTVKICQPSMKLATEYCPEHLLEEKTYKQVHNILYYVDKNNPQGDYPRNPQTDPQFTRWEGPVIAWAEGQDFEREDPPTETDDMHTAENQPKIEIITPDDNDVVDEVNLTMQVEVNAPMGTKKVDFYVDDTLFGSDSSGPYSYTYNLNSVTNGIHKLTARIYDIVDNSTETNVSVNIKIDRPPVVELKSPSGTVNLTSSDFPLNLSADVYASSGVKNVKFYQTLSDTDELIDSIKSSSGSLYEVNWPYPGVGSYQVYVIATDSEGRSKTSSKVRVVIE